MQRLAGELLRDDHVWIKLRASDALYVAALGEIALGQAQAAAGDLRRAIDLLGGSRRQNTENPWFLPARESWAAG